MPACPTCCLFFSSSCQKWEKESSGGKGGACSSMWGQGRSGYAGREMGKCLGEGHRQVGMLLGELQGINGKA